jgi:hypothetical protein
VIERLGIATVSISLLPEVTERVTPPRALVVDRPFGYPLGAPGDPELQRRIIREALSMLGTSLAAGRSIMRIGAPEVER